MILNAYKKQEIMLTVAQYIGWGWPPTPEQSAELKRCAIAAVQQFRAARKRIAGGNVVTPTNGNTERSG